MNGMMDAVRRVVRGSNTAPAEPAPIDLKAQYVHAVTEFISAGRRYDRQGEMYYWRARLHEIRHRAQEDGHADAMEGVWVEPPVNLNVEVLDWYQSAVDHVLRGGPAPGDKPLHPREPEYWLTRYRSLVADYLRGHRSGDRTTTGHTANKLGQLPALARVSLGDRFSEVMNRFGPGLMFVEGEAALDAWEREVNHRLQHGASSGQYTTPQPGPFLRVMVDERMHSPVVLLAPHGPEPLGARVMLDPGVSHELVEMGRATWCEPTRVPEDPRPPVEREPEPDWRKVTFLRNVRTRSRHLRQEGEVVMLPPDEADEMLTLGTVELWTAPLPPPPPPPRPVTIFGTANA